ncbi:MAG: hypothetical protein ACXWXO_15115 [Nocardioides sp.]
MPLLRGVSNERLFFDRTRISLADGSTVPASLDSDLIDVYEGYAETLFPDGYHVSIRGEGRRRELAESSMFGVGRLSPDRSTIFDLSMWPSAAVVYESTAGRQRPIDAPWKHFSLVGWSDEDTYFGVAEQIDQQNIDNVLRAQQVVICELRTLACTAVSPVIPTTDNGQAHALLVEGSSNQL